MERAVPRRVQAIAGYSVAKNRIINTQFWYDAYIFDLKPKDKLVFLYLLTNPITNIAGIYEVPDRRISIDTGLSVRDVRGALDRFSGDGKIMRYKDWVYIKNFSRHQANSPKIAAGIDAIVEELPHDVREYLYEGKGVPAQPTQPQVLPAAPQVDYQEVVDHYHNKINKAARFTESARLKVKARLRTFNMGELLTAIDNFAADNWQMEHNANRGMAWFFHTDDRIDGYLNKQRQAGKFDHIFKPKGGQNG